MAEMLRRGRSPALLLAINLLRPFPARDWRQARTNARLNERPSLSLKHAE
jgi:hypothetical protein